MGDERPQWQVHKFGGTSLADADRIRHVAELVVKAEGRALVVVSAVAKVTDALHGLLHGGSVEAVVGVHRGLARELLKGEARDAELARLDRDEAALSALVAAHDSGPAAEPPAPVVSFGELWSARLLSGTLTGQGHPCTWADASEFLTIRHRELGPVLDREQSAARWRDAVPEAAAPVIVTGYRARLADGAVTTLGRNGSDLSASLIALLVGAERLTIWSDVDGLLNADPRLVEEASVLRELSYSEALELAHFGASVLHPRAIGPAIEAGLPIELRNTLRPEQPGTVIHGAAKAEGGVKGVSAQTGLALLNLEGAGLVGVPGTAERLFAAMHAASVSVILISQAGSEHSICFAVPDLDAERARAAVAEAFAADLQAGYVERISVLRDCSVIAIVGAGMWGKPGIAGEFFAALGSAGVNVLAIAQGSSEQNISAVIAAADTARALRTVHSRFYLSPVTVSIGVIGAGVVGAELLTQLAREIPRLRARTNIDLRVRAIARSSAMVLADRPLDLTDWARRLDEDGRPTDLDAFADHVQVPHLPHAVIIDATAGDAVADHYEAWLGRGIHVVTPNKRAGSGDIDRYRRIWSQRRSRAHLLYETTVGAGLPIIQTLRDLCETGDRMIAIEGMLSGTLSYLFNRFDGSCPFSEIVLEAKGSGYTEPDPRDDLTGMDVARKLVILGREAGLTVSVADLEVENLVPDELREVDLGAFLRSMPTMDARMAARRSEAEARGCVLRFVGELRWNAEGGFELGRVGLREVPKVHPFAHTSLTDNIVRFTSERYRDAPLIVQGPGAGPAVTAGGAFADLLRLCTYLGAKL